MPGWSNLGHVNKGNSM